MTKNSVRKITDVDRLLRYGDDLVRAIDPGKPRPARRRTAAALDLGAAAAARLREALASGEGVRLVVRTGRAAPLVHFTEVVPPESAGPHHTGDWEKVTCPTCRANWVPPAGSGT